MKKYLLASCMVVAATVFIGCDNKPGKENTTKKTETAPKETVVEDGPSVDVITSGDGSVDSVYYDAEGKLMRIVQGGKDIYGEAKQPVTDVFAYTADGKLGNITHSVSNTNGNPTVSKYIFSYTKEGRLYTCTHRYPGKPQKGVKKTPMEESKDVISYTKTGALLKIENGNLTREYAYDTAGRIIRQVITDFDENGDKSRDEVWRYTYDTKSRCIQAVGDIVQNVGMLNEDSVSNVYRFEYDTKDRCISENDCGEVTINYNYNSKGCQVNYEANVGGQILITDIKAGSAHPRNLLYRQCGTDLFNAPYYINLDVVCLPLSWFNAGVNDSANEKKE